MNLYSNFNLGSRKTRRLLVFLILYIKCPQLMVEFNRALGPSIYIAFIRFRIFYLAFIIFGIPIKKIIMHNMF